MASHDCQAPSVTSWPGWRSARTPSCRGSRQWRWRRRRRPTRSPCQQRALRLVAVLDVRVVGQRGDVVQVGADVGRAEQRHDVAVALCREASGVASVRGNTIGDAPGRGTLVVGDPAVAGDGRLDGGRRCVSRSDRQCGKTADRERGSGQTAEKPMLRQLSTLLSRTCEARGSTRRVDLGLVSVTPAWAKIRPPRPAWCTSPSRRNRPYDRPPTERKPRSPYSREIARTDYSDWPES